MEGYSGARFNGHCRRPAHCGHLRGEGDEPSLLPRHWRAKAVPASAGTALAAGDQRTAEPPPRRGRGVLSEVAAEAPQRTQWRAKAVPALAGTAGDLRTAVPPRGEGHQPSSQPPPGGTPALFVATARSPSRRAPYTQPPPAAGTRRRNLKFGYCTLSSQRKIWLLYSVAKYSS